MVQWLWHFFVFVLSCASQSLCHRVTWCVPLSSWCVLNHNTNWLKAGSSDTVQVYLHLTLDYTSYSAVICFYSNIKELSLVKTGTNPYLQIWYFWKPSLMCENLFIIFIICVSIKADLHVLCFLRVFIKALDRNTRRMRESKTKLMPRIKLIESLPSLCVSGETSNQSQVSSAQLHTLSSSKSIYFAPTYRRFLLSH